MTARTADMVDPWVQHAARSRLEAAYATLARLCASNGVPAHIQDAWAVLDRHGRRGALPARWERLTATQIAQWLDMTPSNWRTRVTTGYAPPADGDDGAGRSWWHPATITAYLEQEWEPSAAELARRPAAPVRPVDQPPPVSGPGSSADAWREYLATVEIPAPLGATRAELISLAEQHGLTRRSA